MSKRKINLSGGRNMRVFNFLVIIFCSFQLSAAKSDTTSVTYFKPKHELRFTAGVQPYEAYYKNFVWFNDEPDFIQPNYYFNFTPKTYYAGTRYTAGLYALNYIFHLNKRLSVGATIACSYYYNNLYDIDTYAKVGRGSSSHLGIYPKLYVTWLQKPAFSIYQSVGVGPGLISTKTKVGYITNRNTIFNLDGECTLLGFTVGKTVYAVGEILTFGSEGFVKLGVGYRFNVDKK